VHIAACGYYHKLVLTEDGAVWTCGKGENGLLGHGDLCDMWVLKHIAPAAFGGARIVFVATGSYNAFAVTAEGILYFWGSDAVFPDAAPGRQRRRPSQRASRRASALGGAVASRACTASSFAWARKRAWALALDTIDAVLAHGVRLDGDLVHMGEGLLRQLAVRARKN